MEVDVVLFLCIEEVKHCAPILLLTERSFEEKLKNKITRCLLVQTSGFQFPSSDRLEVQCPSSQLVVMTLYALWIPESTCDGRTQKIPSAAAFKYSGFSHRASL